MIDIRSSTATTPNTGIRQMSRRPGEGNAAWLARVAGDADPAGTLVLFGGAGLTDFRLRVAQSHARQDLLPSFWSHVALVAGRTARDWTLLEVRLEPKGGFASVPLRNAIQRGSVLAYDDPARFPNVAHIRFTAVAQALGAGETLAALVRRAALDLQKQRSAVDLVALLVEWLGYAWGVADMPNPLQRQRGVPSAVFVASAFAVAGIELTPGAASQSSCPETIWQAAKWWHDFYASAVTITQAAPTGVCVIDQPAAAVLIEPSGLAAAAPRPPRGATPPSRPARPRRRR